MNTIEKIKRNGLIPYINSCSADYTKKVVDECVKLGIDVVKINPQHLNELFPQYPDVSFVEEIGDAKTIEIACGTDIEEVIKTLKDTIIETIGLKLHHIGINTQNEEEALRVAELIELAFNKHYKIGNSSIFSGTKEIEIMKKMGRGKNGHIAFGVNDVDQAMYFLSKLGTQFDMDSLVVKEDVKIAIYIKDEIGGFAFHLVKA